MIRKSSTRETFSREVCRRVQMLQKNSGWGAYAIKSQIVARELPGHDRVTAGMISSILYNDTLKTVDPEILSSVLEVLQSLPEGSNGASTYDKSASRVALEPKLVEALNAALDQTSLSVPYLLKANHAPEGLGPVTLHKIRTGKQRSIRKSHRAFLQNLIETLNKA